MPGKIRGVTIEIGGDTSKLTKALKDVDKGIASTQKSLRDVNKLLKFDPGNTDLLKQKQQLLGRQVEDTAKKLEELQKAQKEMDAAGVDKTSDQYMALQREIIATEGSLKNLKKQAKDASSIFGQQLEVISGKIKAVGKQLQDLGGQLTQKITAPIMAIGGASLAAWGQVDEGLDTVIQKTGATGEALESMQNSVQNIAKTMPTSFATAGEAIGEVYTRFGVTGDELEKLSTKFIKFAQLNGTDVTSAVDASQKALSAWGLSAKDADGYLDTLTKVSQDTGISVESLNSGLLNNAAAFQEMGLSIDQAAGFMGQIEKSGGNTDQVLGGLRKVLKSASKDGKDMATTLSELQDEILNGADGVDGLTKAYELFGKSGDQVFNAIKSGSLSFEDMAKAATDAGGTVEDTFAAMQDPADQWQVVLNNLMSLGYEIGEAIMPTIQKAVEAIIPVIEQLTSWWESLGEDMQGFIVTAALVVAAVGPIISVIGTVVGAIGGVVGAIGTVVSVLGGPLTLAIGAAIAIGVALWKNWDTVKTKAGELFSAVKEKWDAIKKTITDAIDGAKKAVSEGIEKIKNLFNFRFEWPKLKMPHFKVEGTLNPLKWLEQGMPKISVDWYAKAKDRPYLFTQPSLIGVGDVPEVVVGADAFKRMTQANSGSVVVNNTFTVVQQPGQSAEQLADAIERRITLKLQAAGRTW